MSLGRKAPLLLGSASPRRRRLLAAVQDRFETVAPMVREVHRRQRPRWTVRENALRKLAWCRERYPHHRILTADTVVAHGGICLGKPGTRREADGYLRRLSGATHRVYSGVAYWDADDGHVRCTVVETRVTFKRLSPADRRAYLTCVNPLDKAGAYDIDDHGELLIEHVEGSRSNVAGLPLDVVRGWLQGFTRTRR